MPDTISKIGKVFLAGAGPGDPELISVKACNVLATADVVITDRLVSDEIIRKYVNPFAEIIYAGKQAGKGYSTRQTTINGMIVDHALSGKTVVRLKGGDISLFSNVLDELEALKNNNIDYEIIPGITAAAGASSYAAIPLTARGFSTAVRFLTCYKHETVSENNWNDLAKTDDTLVFYMSANMAGSLAENLLLRNISADKKIAVIEQATTPMQQVEIFGFDEIDRLKSRKFKSPSLIIVGKVVSLHEQYKWLQNYSGDKEYFNPLTNITSLKKTGTAEFVSAGN